jgi:hypothetical protein
MPKLKIGCIVLVMSSITALHAMVYDDRDIPPLFARPRLALEGTNSNFSVEGLFATASKAVGDNEAKLGLPELHGTFDQQQLAKAFVISGRPNPLRSEWQGVDKIAWKMEGKRQIQGVACAWNQAVHKYLSFGFSWVFLYANSRNDFKLAQTNLFLGEGDRLELDEIRRGMLQTLDLQEGNTIQAGFGDIDFYIRVGNVWEYIYKLRKIDVGLRVGVLFPTGVRRDIARPASIPFGGNGHWGMYVAFDGIFEVKEDLKVGFYARISKRFPRTSIQHMSVNGEPDIFGAVTGPVHINPGVTGVFSPYVVLENLRKGLGVSVQYTLTAHQEDEWCDQRADKTVPVRLGKTIALSEWASDYFTLNVFYDFGKVKIVRELEPVISLRWDVPTTLFITKHVPKMYKVSLGIEFAF